MNANHHENSSQVAPEFACPQCGERETDLLICQDDDTVTCWKCGCNYDPLPK